MSATDGFPPEPFVSYEEGPHLEWDDLTREELVQIVKQSASSMRANLVKRGMAVGDSDINLCWRLAPGRWFSLDAEPGTFDRLHRMFTRS